MVRKIIHIGEEKRSGCGASACHEGAIDMVDGKAKLVREDFFDGAKLLIATDCTAYACANLHEEFMRGKVTLIGCPKLGGFVSGNGLFTFSGN